MLGMTPHTEMVVTTIASWVGCGVLAWIAWVAERDNRR